MENTTPNANVVSCDTTPIAGWDKAVASWRWKVILQNPPIIHYGIEGPCPNCGDHMSATYSYIPVVMFEAEAENFVEASGKEGPPEAVPVHCNCTITHPPCSQGQGCGQYAYIPLRNNIRNP